MFLLKEDFGLLFSNLFFFQDAKNEPTQNLYVKMCAYLIVDAKVFGQNCFQYLCNSINNNGSFIYEISVKKNTISNDYNILRHAGALYTIYQWQNLFSKNSVLNENVNIAANYLIKRFHSLGVQKEDLLCPSEKNELKLGGAALSLLALIERYKINANLTDWEIMKGLANFIVWMQEPSGKFKSKYIYTTKKFSKFDSVYYHGQSILALIKLYQVDRNSLWLQRAKISANFYVKNPALDKNKNRAYNHWLVIALSELCIIKANEDYYNEIYNLTVPVVNSIQSNFKKSDNKLRYSSASIATRGEAIVALAELEKHVENQNRVKELLPVIEHILEYCSTLQIKDTSIYSENKLVGGIIKDKYNPVIRIDYVQHVLQVVMGYLQIKGM